MQPSSLHSFRFMRAFGASVALLALAMATGVPTVHAWAHEVAGDSHHHSGLTLVDGSSSHHDEHPSELHADWLALRDVEIDLSPALPSVRHELVAAAVAQHPTEAMPEARPPGSVPPAPSSARGPPIV